MNLNIFTAMMRSHEYFYSCDRQNIQKPDAHFINVQTKFIFVTGGVMSGLGKGVTSSSIAKLLQLADQSVSCIKIDPYTNRTGKLRIFL